MELENEARRWVTSGKSPKLQKFRFWRVRQEGKPKNGEIGTRKSIEPGRGHSDKVPAWTHNL